MAEYVHRCDFCGWSRNAHSAAMTEPWCEACGCGLTSLRASDIPPPRPSDVDELARLLPPLGPSLRDALRLAFVVLLTAAAARWGLIEGGPAIAFAALGVAGLMVLPMAVPARYGDSDVGAAQDDPPAAAAGVPSRHG